jgi:hypothetical protein
MQLWMSIFIHEQSVSLLYCEQHNLVLYGSSSLYPLREWFFMRKGLIGSPVAKFQDERQQSGGNRVHP